MSIFPATHSRKQKDFSVTTLAKPTSVACEVRFLFEFCVVIKTGVVGEFGPLLPSISDLIAAMQLPQSRRCMLREHTDMNWNVSDDETTSESAANQRLWSITGTIEC